MVLPVALLGLAIGLLLLPVAFWTPRLRNGTLRLRAAPWSPLTWAVLRWLGSDWAMTVGLVMMSTADVTDRWERHENRHVEQAFALGVVLVVVWALSGLWFGYRDSILETDARAHE